MNIYDKLKKEGWTIEVGWIGRNTFGDCSHDRERIRINVQLLVVETFLHEWYHARNEDWSEAKVEKATYKRLQHMTISEFEELYEAIIMDT